MGADIHLFSEKKKSINGEEKWVNCDYWMINPHFGEDEHEPELEVVSLYSNRNYDLFGILADVRGGGPSICGPKGLPDDVSPIVKKESERWEDDGHSHSYFTLAELKEYYKYNNDTPVNGFISVKQSEELDSGESKPEWWGEWSSPHKVYREWKQDSPLKTLINNVYEKMRKEFWVRDEDENVSEFDEKIRIVFWFDN
jgi:hypothetical protein